MMRDLLRNIARRLLRDLQGRIHGLDQSLAGHGSQSPAGAPAPGVRCMGTTPRPRPQGLERQEIRKIGELVNPRIQHFTEAQRGRAHLAFRSFAEYFDRLEARFADAAALERLVRLSDEGTTPTNETLHELQMQLVDKTEAFHQHIYAALSAYVALLRSTLSQSESTRLPRNSITKFMRHVATRSHSSSLHTHITRLERSVTFRNKFVDHTQQQDLHDWMTYNSMGPTVVIYFLPPFERGQDVALQERQDHAKERSQEPPCMDPWDPRFELPVLYESFFVSPNVVETYSAFSAFSVQTMALFLDRPQPGEPESSLGSGDVAT